MEKKDDKIKNKLDNIMNNFTADELSEKYSAYKKAEEEFKTIYEPFKTKLIDLIENDSDFVDCKKIVIGDLGITYVSPSIRNGIDTKKLKEEMPEIAKEFNKVTKVSSTLRLEETNIIN